MVEILYCPKANESHKYSLLRQSGMYTALDSNHSIVQYIYKFTGTKVGHSNRGRLYMYIYVCDRTVE